ncbi:hypothetical protein GOBAR_DD02407 [Gossypium barbadense]|nr:hypothetical protein GOBAR_DD02407 [Gossypium barbadense]
MKLVDNEDVETMVTLYGQNRSGHTEPIQLFTEFRERRRSSIRGFNIDLNTTPVSENLNPSLGLQIHPELIETDTDGEDRYDNHGPFDHEVEDYSDPDLDKVLDDINDEGTNDDGNVYASTIGNPSQGIIVCNDLGDHILIVDPDTIYAYEFPKYSDVLLAYQLVADPEREELFVG